MKLRFARRYFCDFSEISYFIVLYFFKGSFVIVCYSIFSLESQSGWVNLKRKFFCIIKYICKIVLLVMVPLHS